MFHIFPDFFWRTTSIPILTSRTLSPRTPCLSVHVSFLSLLGKDEVTFLLDCTCFFSSSSAKWEGLQDNISFLLQAKGLFVRVAMMRSGILPVFLLRTEQVESMLSSYSQRFGKKEGTFMILYDFMVIPLVVRFEQQKERYKPKNHSKKGSIPFFCGKTHGGLQGG